MNELYELIKEKIFETVLRDYDIHISLTPKREVKRSSIKKKVKKVKFNHKILDNKSNRKKSEKNGVGRPKTDEVKNKVNEVLNVLASSPEHSFTLPDLNDALGITEDSEKSRVPYYLKLLINNDKVYKRRNDERHITYRLKQEAK